MPEDLEKKYCGDKKLCMLPIIEHGEGVFDTWKQPDWLPERTQKDFWLMNFGGEKSTRMQAEMDLKQKVEKVEGAIHIPLERGRYRDMYKYDDLYFVPITHPTEKRVKFMHIPKALITFKEK